MLKKGQVMFGSFNNLLKHSASAKRAWARVLLKVENSSMMIKAPVFHLQAQVAIWEKSFSENAANVPGFNFKSPAKLKKKLIFKPSTQSQASHLALYNEMDIMLDSWPYSGTITTTEALLMGVPVVTMCATGEASRHSQNVSASILTQVGLADLIASSEDEFVRIAAELAANPDRLRELKQTLRSKALETIANPHPQTLCSEVEGDAHSFQRFFCFLKRHFLPVPLHSRTHARSAFFGPSLPRPLHSPTPHLYKDAAASPSGH
jgi:predicted O-linked N-acetylglucosamine transferase (SPINDLY family)